MVPLEMDQHAQMMHTQCLMQKEQLATRFTLCTLYELFTVLLNLNVFLQEKIPGIYSAPPPKKNCFLTLV